MKTTGKHFSGFVVTRGPTTQCELVDRCFITRLGSPSKRSSDFRHLEFSGEQLLLKLIRNEGCSVSSDSFREHIVEKQSSIEMRQLDSCVIFQQGRGDEVLSTVMLVWEIFQWSISYNSCGSVSSNTDLSSLIKGIFNSNPCVEPLYPKRDLPLVLLALCKPPFEQLATCH